MSCAGRISIDCHGGDRAPDIVIHGLAKAISECPGFEFILFGEKKSVQPLIEKYHIDTSCVRLVETDGFQVEPDMKPSFAIRNAMRSSMGMAISCLKAGEADACISAGNTGAYMGLAKVILRTMEGVQRPAIASVIPGASMPWIMLDLGANAETSSRNLVEFAILGEAFAKAALNVDAPSVALLNIGTEENKGNTCVKEAYESLMNDGELSNFCGFVEGDKIFSGETNVVVSDGFCGNVTLKVIEGCAKFVMSGVREAFMSSIFSKAAGLIAKPVLKKSFVSKFDPRLHNGAVLLGVNGIVVKSHGGTDEVGFANAIVFTADIVRKKLVEHTAKIMDARKIHDAPKTRTGEGV